MDIRKIKADAAEALSAAGYCPGKLALLHSGVALLLSLLLTLASFLLTRQIDASTGLSAIGTRTVLSAVRTLLTIAGTAALPFWEFGFLRAALNWSRREPAEPATLPEGFRRFGPVLRLILLRSLLCAGIVFLCLQAASILFMLSPMSLPLLEQMDALLASGDASIPDAAVMESLLPHLYPVYGLFAVLLCVLLVPVLYRLRLADWAVMDRTAGALAAMRLSSYCMRGNRFRLFRLDLSFWWFYAAQLLAAVLAYGDQLLPLLGIAVNADAAFFGFYAASLFVQLVLAWRFGPLIQTTYATAYNALSTQLQPAPPPVPGNQTWV